MSSSKLLRSRLAGAVMTGVVLYAGSAFGQNAAPPKPAAPAAAKPAAPAAAPKSAAPAAPAASGDVVARVGKEDITIGEVRSFLAGLGAREQVALSRDPAMLSQTLRMMLANRLVLKEAQSKKWEEKADIAAQLQRIRENAIAETYLASVSAPPADYPDDATLKSAYEANKDAFLMPRQFEISQIFVGLAEDADAAAQEAARKKIAEITGKLKQPKADFSAVAKEFSEHAETAARGGEIGWLPEDQIRPEIKTQVMALEKGAVGEPIKLDGGWHIIKLIDTKAAGMRTFEEVREALAQRLRTQQTEVLRRTYLARLLEQNPPAINELALSKAFPAADETSQPAK
jgi:parvulin-like peptidyl-prolyl isomerase